MADRLITASTAFTAAYRADDLRAWKQTTSSGTRTYFLYDADQLLAEVQLVSGSYVVTNLYGWGSVGLIERYSPQSRLFYAYTFDPSGNLVMRHNSSPSADCDYTALYDAFGAQHGCLDPLTQTESQQQDAIGFAGQWGHYTDNETYAVGAAPTVRMPWTLNTLRYYDPATGRYLSRGSEGASGLVSLYTYADNNPVSTGVEGHSDPLNWQRFVGDSLAGIGGGILGGPPGAAGGVALFEGLYDYGEGHSVQHAVVHGGVAGATTYVGGKVLGAVGGRLASTRMGQAAISRFGGSLSRLIPGSIRNINPGFPGLGRTENCANCAVATDALLAGRPASALPGTPILTFAQIAKLFGKSNFRMVASQQAIEAELLNAGPGARGIVGLDWGNGNAHVFNAVNQGGVIRFLDGQSGTVGSFRGAVRLLFLRTN